MTARVLRIAGQVAVVDDAGMPVGACAAFLDRYLVRGLSRLTVEAYAFDLALIHRWLEVEELELAQVGAAELHRFLAWERARASQPKSINRRLHTLRLYFRFAVGRPLPGGDETAGRWRRSRRDRDLGLNQVQLRNQRQLRVKEPRRVVEPLTVEQVRALLGSLRRYRDLCIAYTMLLCGLRSQEALGLRLSDVDFADRRLRVLGKGHKERVLPMPPLLTDLLRQYLALERPDPCKCNTVFVVLQGVRRGQPMTRAALRSVFRTRRKRRGLRNANPHRLRHTFGTDMARCGVRLPILQRMLGHSDLTTTMGYINISMVDVAAEFERAAKIVEARYLGGGVP